MQEVLSHPRTLLNLNALTILVFVRLNCAPNCEKLEFTADENFGKIDLDKMRGYAQEL